MSFRVPLERKNGGAGAAADDCAQQQRVSRRPAPVPAVLLALLYPLRFFAWLTGDSK